MASRKIQQIWNHLNTVKVKDVLSIDEDKVGQLADLSYKLSKVAGYQTTKVVSQLKNVQFLKDHESTLIKDFPEDPLKSNKVYPPKPWPKAPEPEEPEIELRKENGKEIKPNLGIRLPESTRRKISAGYKKPERPTGTLVKEKDQCKDVNYPSFGPWEPVVNCPFCDTEVFNSGSLLCPLVCPKCSRGLDIIKAPRTARRFVTTYKPRWWEFWREWEGYWQYKEEEQNKSE